jgi:hypothetical protein
MNTPVLAAWASDIDAAPRLDSFHAGIEVCGTAALSIFATYYGLRFLRRLLAV